MRYFIKLAYKGTDFHGWQHQPNVDSIQDHIENALTILLKDTIEITGCGRTDAGVHASQYFAHFDTEQDISLDSFAYKLNALLPKSLVIYEILPVIDKAHARFDAIERSYEYHVLLENNPFKLETTWQIPNRDFNIALMNVAAGVLLQHHDFQSFSKTHTDVSNYLCNITAAHWVLEEKELTFYITSNRFLRNMVRSIVGTLLEVGEQKITIDAFEQIIKSKDRKNAGLSVPAQGLFLSEIVYPKNLFKR